MKYDALFPVFIPTSSEHCSKIWFHSRCFKWCQDERQHASKVLRAAGLLTACQEAVLMTEQSLSLFPMGVYVAVSLSILPCTLQ